MIESSQYLAIVNRYFNFLITEFDFKTVEEKIRGNLFYDVQYQDAVRVISISYENIEDYFQVIVFLLQDGELPDYDDKTKTLHLNRLTAKVLSTVSKPDIHLNNKYFKKFIPDNEFQRKVLKSAKELRLCLEHFGEF
jgi:hypothetical protein